MLKPIKIIINDLESLIGKRVKFTSDCEFFPINEVCKVLSIRNGKSNDEKLIKVRVIRNNKIIDIGTNMSHLKFEIQK